MQWFTNRSLSTKLMLGFALIGVLIVVVGGIGLNGAMDTNACTAEINQAQFKPNMKIAAIRGQTQRLRAYIAHALILTDPQEVEAGIQKAAQIQKGIEDIWAKYEPDIRNEEEKKAFEGYRGAALAYKDLYTEKVLPPLRAGKKDLAFRGIDEISFGGDSHFDKVIAGLDNVLEKRTAAADRQYEQAQSTFRTTFAWVAGTSIGGIILALALGFTLARLIGRPLNRTMTVLEAVANGDLSQRVEIKSTDEVGRMAKALNVAVAAISKARNETQEANNEIKSNAAREAEQAEELRRKVDQILSAVNGLAEGDFSREIPNLGDDAVGQMAKALNQAIASVRSTLQDVRNIATTVSAAAGELSSASEEIASGAQQQASSLEETAASLEQITATIKQNTDSAQQARQLAGASKEVAEKGGQVVGSAVEAMAAINQSSKKIADIITAIDEIAFQTNLLALNAAVEAARAGEQGRGFAVVAAEVRNLAQRSATAAKEIKGLIQDSVRKVDNGTDLVNRSGVTLNEIVTSVKRVTDIITEIAAASREQSTGVDQVNKAVAQMDRVTQTNAGQTEELSATSQTLLGHADQLQSLVSRFKLGAEMIKRPASASRPVKKTQAKPRVADNDRARERVLNIRNNASGQPHDLDRVGLDGGFKEF